MPSDPKKPRAAYVEDYDEDDKAVRGTRRSASTKGKSKESEKSLSPKSTRVEVVRERSSSDKSSRRTSMSGASARSPRKSSRPPLTRERATAPLPQLEIPLRPKVDPSFYGVSPDATYTPNSSARSRPSSYYGGMPSVVSAPVAVSRPPLSRSSWYQQPSVVGASYPMASPADSFMRLAPRSDYFVPDALRNRDHLAERFARGDPISRTTSAQGYRAIGDGFSQPSFDQDSDRQTIRRRAKEVEDLRRMPPPPPPKSVSVVDARNFLVYPADDYSNRAMYDRRSSYREPSPAPSSVRPTTNRGSTYGYGPDPVAYQVDVPSQRRRASYFEGVSPSTFEDKMRQATGYQEEVTGGPPHSLTAEALRKQQQRTEASRSSTHSSGASRNESDFQRSATTQTSTSRVGPDGEDFVIKVRGDATVNIGGAEIKCNDGAELNIVRSKNKNFNGSERSASEYGALAMDDRRSRGDRRPSGYSRSASKSAYSSHAPVNSRYGNGFIQG